MEENENREPEEETPEVDVTVNMPEADPSPPTPPEPPRSENGSEHSTELRILRENQELMFQRLQQLASMLQTERDEQRQIMTEMLDTMKVVQQIAGEFDAKIQQIGDVTAALIKLEMIWRQRLQPQQQSQLS